jgi:putative ABC transport system permease protein
MRALLAAARHLSLPYATRHAGRVALVLIAVSLGVSTIVASGTLVESAIGSLETTWSLDSSADLRVANGFVGVDEGLLEAIRRAPGVAAADGLLVEVVRAQLDGRSVDLQVFAIDILAPGVLQQGFGRTESARIDDMAFLTRLNAIALPSEFAARHELDLGSVLEAETRVGPQSFYVAGIVPASRTSDALGGAVAVMDLLPAQRVFGRVGLLDSIEVELAKGADAERVRSQLEEVTAGQATVSLVGSRQPELASLVFNLRLILNTIGAIALAVGALIIYNAIEMMASERKAQIDLVWSLGASRRMLGMLLCSEALALAAVGIVLGVGAGIGLARLAMGTFGSAVGTLYVPVLGGRFALSTGSVVAGAALALVLTLLVSLRTAISAARASFVLTAASPSRARWRLARVLAGAGCLLVAFGLLISRFYPSAGSAEALAALLIAGDIPVLLGIGLAVPVGLMALAPLVARARNPLRSPVLHLAWLGLTGDPARSAAVMAAVLIAVANVVNTAGVVGSVRSAVLAWLAETQRADLIVSAAGSVPFLASAPPISAGLVDRLRGAPGIESVDAYRLVAQPYADRWVVVAARDPDTYGTRQPIRLVAGDLPSALRAFRSGTGVLLSEDFATLHGLGVGEEIELRTPSGPARFKVAGVVVDYSGDLGTVVVANDVYRERWRDAGVTGIQVWLDAGVSPGEARESVLAALGSECDCAVLTRDEFRARADAVIDASFASMYALQLVASAVMVVAVFAFFSISLSERRSQIEALSTIGASRRQIVTSVLWEAGILSIVGASLGCAACLWLGRRLVEEGIRASGGMVIEFVVPTGAMLLTGVVVTVVGLLAALGPALSVSAPRHRSHVEP